MPIAHVRNVLSLIAVLALLAACSGESGSGNATQAGVESSAFSTAALIDPNTASEATLAAVPGMSAAAVAAILDARPFATPSELDAAIGDALDAAGRKMVYALVFIKVGLNSGAEEDYKLIPSTMSPQKLAHEFEEYRPYESMEQFSREMSKYVSDAEVAYLERFVTMD